MILGAGVFHTASRLNETGKEKCSEGIWFFVTKIRRKGCKRDKDRPLQHLANGDCRVIQGSSSEDLSLRSLPKSLLFPNKHCERKSCRRLWKAARCSLFALPSSPLLRDVDVSVHL